MESIQGLKQQQCEQKAVRTQDQYWYKGSSKTGKMSRRDMGHGSSCKKVNERRMFRYCLYQRINDDLIQHSFSIRHRAMEGKLFLEFTDVARQLSSAWPCFRVVPAASRALRYCTNLDAHDSSGDRQKPKSISRTACHLPSLAWPGCCCDSYCGGSVGRMRSARPNHQKHH